VAYQSEVFGKERALENPIFSNLDLDSSGNVTFTFTTDVNPGFIAYTRKAAQAGASQSGDVEPLVPVRETTSQGSGGVQLTNEGASNAAVTNVASSTATTTKR
jgi:hypothetical protein